MEEFSAFGRYHASIPVPTPAGRRARSPWRRLGIQPELRAGQLGLRSSPRQGSSCGRSAPPRPAYGDLGDPGGIAVGPGGRVYVAQPDYGLVSVFSPAGLFYTEFGLQPGAGQADEDLEFPQGLAVTATGQIWVADSGHNRIVRVRLGSRASRRTGRAGHAGSPSRPLIIGEVPAGPRPRRPRLVPRPPRQPDPVPRPPILIPPARRRPPPRPSSAVAGVLTTATALSGVAVGAAVLPASLRRALAATLKRPARAARSRDIEHIVILMQENRSFDHYFGTMPGVRGFSDPAAIRLPDGNPVFRQPYPGHAQGYLTPFRYDTIDDQRAGHARHRSLLADASTRPGTTARWTSGSRPRARSRWGTSPRPTSRSSGRWPQASRSATTTTARCSARLTPTGCTCGPG